ncbi:aldose epimerase family protein [Robertkochia flava]|uniref:aldose epimerase family protein n=1 Tax=Robertkochia flava TaxID=3447986 RepID=UPI001CCEBC77|nr:aldose epimerase family protein [Robertkochia marina]
MKDSIIKNSHLELHTCSTGASMTALFVRTASGKTVNVIYGYSDADRYQENPFFMGATCGRYAGRIGNHAFEIDNRKYLLESSGTVHLHGGRQTLAFREWKVKAIDEGDHPSITYEIHSSHMEGGYPGNVVAEARYSLVGNSLHIDFLASSDRATYLNLTNHNYYNLDGGGSICDHSLKLNADRILSTDTMQVPDGGFLDISQTPFDHTTEKRLGITLENTVLDHTFVLGKQEPQAILYAPGTGLEMKLRTNQPGVVIFTPEELGTGPFRNLPPEKFPAICLETQNFPNAPNIKAFPSSLLEKGKLYKNQTVLTFAER